MFPNLHVSCTECTSRKNLSDFIQRAYDRMQNFWSGVEERPVINKREIPLVCSTAETICDANFKPDENFYASMNFHLSTGLLTFFFYPYPDTVKTGANPFPDFSKPVNVFSGKYVL